MRETNLSRRSFLGAAAAAAVVGAGALTSCGASSAGVSTSQGSYTYADTFNWAAEYDVVVLGMGFAGLASAMEAADANARVLICEKAPEGESGGNSRVCGQCFAFGNDDYDATLAYYTALSGSRDVPQVMLETIADSVSRMKTILSEKYELDPTQFTESSFAGKAEYPEFPGAEKVLIYTAHPGVSDSFLYQTMRTRLEEKYIDAIDVWFESPGISLIQEPTTGAVIGVEVERDGKRQNIRALNGVCVCTGGFENNYEMMENYANVIDHGVCGSLYNTGDGILMCMDVGCKLWHMTAYEGMGSPLGCGYYDPQGVRSTGISFSLAGSLIAVGTWGKRFGNETYTMRHGHAPTGNGLWENVEYPEKMFIICDKTKMDEIDESGKFNENYRDMLVECPDLATAAKTIGCNVEDLQATLDDYNFYATVGRDYAFGRDPEKMRPFDGEAYYVLPIKNRILNTQGGPQRNEKAEVLNIDGEPIPHLYSAGEIGGTTALMYHAGTNVAECFIFGQIAGANAAVPKEPLPDYVAREIVQSAPLHLGDVTDLLNDGVAVDLKDGEYLGVGTGIGGDVPVIVTFNEDGSIATVVVGENNETEGIGSSAVEQLPSRLIGLATVNEVDAVDAVSGATVTSKAIKEAVKEALGQQSK